MNADQDTAHEAQEDDPQIECWCGAKGTHDELFDLDGLDSRCGGTGTLSCHCGGDLCACHHHGEVECLGCADCEPEETPDHYDDLLDYDLDDDL